MPSRTPSFHGKPVFVGAPVSRSAGTVDLVLDMKGYKWAEIMVLAGTVTGSGTLDVSIRESAASDGSSSTVVNDEDGNAAAFAQITSANDDALYVGEVFCASRKRYLVIRLVTAVAANITGVLARLSGQAQSKQSTPVFRTV